MESGLVTGIGMQSEARYIAGQIATTIAGPAADLTRVSDRGSCNHVFIVTADPDKLVIRMNNDRDSNEFLKEDWCMTQARASGVRVPKPISRGVLAGWNFSVQSFEGDENGADVQDQLSVWHWLGRMAARFHRVSVQGFGLKLLDEKAGRFDSDWQDYVTSNIEALAKRRCCECLSETQVTDLHYRFERLAEKRFEFGLCHGDLTPRNVVLDDDLKTLIDWGCAEAHVVPHFDFRELLRDNDFDSAEVRAFASGYGLNQAFASLLPEIESVLLICAYDVVRWAKDGAPAQVAEKEQQLRNYLGRFRIR